MSIGDAHFAQGDGEVCGSAIEMAATFRLRFQLHKAAAKNRGIRGVQFDGVEVARPARRYYATTGLSMRGEEIQESEDATLAARNALLAMIDYLQHRGFTGNRPTQSAVSPWTCALAKSWTFQTSWSRRSSRSISSFERGERCCTLIAGTSPEESASRIRR